MTDPQLLDPVLADLDGRLRDALSRAGLPEADPGFERPRQPEHGDWATTVALRLAKSAERRPRDIAERLVAELELPETVAEAEVAGPGFVNFRFAHRYFQDALRRVLDEGPAYGRRRRPAADAEYVNVEFVSANPTGPLHVGAGRWAATGDAVAALLEADGHRVHREYYVNDTGEQVRRLGESVVLAARGQPRGEEHYQGDYVLELAGEASGEGIDGLLDGELTAELASRAGEIAVASMRQRIEDVLASMGVHFDTWFSERDLHDRGAVDAAVDALRENGHVYEQDGATFLRTAAFGDDKDRVLVRSDGRPTYFAADCAYLRDKWRRGFTRLVYLLGADHHGYVARLEAAAAALGIPADQLEVSIGQLVNVLRGGEPVRMSKRAGAFVTLDEILDEVGPDVTRYHFLRQSLDTTVNFDLVEVVKQSMDNPVYYVQYAHARIASLIRTADEAGFEPGPPGDAELALLTHPAELELLKRMSELPEVVAAAAELRATQRVARYAEELAGAFHRFYTDCRVLQERAALARARYWLAVAAKQVLANALELLRVSAPERM